MHDLFAQDKLYYWHIYKHLLEESTLQKQAD